MAAFFREKSNGKSRNGRHQKQRRELAVWIQVSVTEMEINNTFTVYLGECIDRFTDQFGEQGKEKEKTISGFLLEQLHG